MIAGLWKTFLGAGQHGWAAIIPFYNLWIMVKVAGRTPAWFWMLLICSLIPILDIVALIMMLFVALDVSKNFGHGAGFGVLPWLFPMIMYLVLGFGSSQHRPVTR